MNKRPDSMRRLSNFLYRWFIHKIWPILLRYPNIVNAQKHTERHSCPKEQAILNLQGFKRLPSMA